MSIVVEESYLFGSRTAEAVLRCDTCGTTSSPQGAVGAGCSESAVGWAKAHARVSEGWSTRHEPVVELGKRYTLVRDVCPGCAKVATQRSSTGPLPV